MSYEFSQALHVSGRKVDVRSQLEQYGVTDD